MTYGVLKRSTYVLYTYNNTNVISRWEKKIARELHITKIILNYSDTANNLDVALKAHELPSYNNHFLSR